jgi:hypothetical protein
MGDLKKEDQVLLPIWLNPCQRNSAKLGRKLAVFICMRALVVGDI